MSVQREQLACNSARHRPDREKVEIEPGPAAFERQLQQIVGDAGITQVLLGELDDGPILDVLHLPGMGNEVHRHGLSSAWTNGDEMNHLGGCVGVLPWATAQKDL